MKGGLTKKHRVSTLNSTHKLGERRLKNRAGGVTEIAAPATPSLAGSATLRAFRRPNGSVPQRFPAWPGVRAFRCSAAVPTAPRLYFPAAIRRACVTRPSACPRSPSAAPARPIRLIVATPELPSRARRTVRFRDRGAVAQRGPHPEREPASAAP